MFYGSSKKEAEEAKRNYLEQVEQGINVEAGLDPFGPKFELWYQEVHAPTVGLASRERYETTMRLHILNAAFYNSPLKTIKSITIQQHINKLPSAPIAERVYLLLNMFFKYCIKERIIIFNPLDNVNKPKKVKSSDEKKHLSQKDVSNLLEAFKTDDSLFIYIFALFTGLRQGEILALTHDDINFDTLEVNVNKSLKRATKKLPNGTKKSEVIVSSTKTASSIRKVPIFDHLVDPLKRHMLSEKAKHIKLGIPFRSSNFLFTTNRCTPRRGDRLNSSWRKFQKKQGIEQIKFHGLRHTFCTLLADQGVPLKTASKLMGHSDIDTTAKIYVHVDSKAKSKAISKLSNII